MLRGPTSRGVQSAPVAGRIGLDRNVGGFCTGSKGSLGLRVLLSGATMTVRTICALAIVVLF